MSSFFYKILFIYLRERQHEWGGEAEAEGEADSLLSTELDVGPRSQDPGIMTRAEGRHLTAVPPRRPWTQL